MMNVINMQLSPASGRFLPVTPATKLLVQIGFIDLPKNNSEPTMKQRVSQFSLGAGLESKSGLIL
jgi:hypothetical protein